MIRLNYMRAPVPLSHAAIILSVTWNLFTPSRITMPPDQATQPALAYKARCSEDYIMIGLNYTRAHVPLSDFAYILNRCDLLHFNFSAQTYSKLSSRRALDLYNIEYSSG
jgi:hypothetical protein